MRARTRRCNWAAVKVAATRLVTSGTIRLLRRRRLRLRLRRVLAGSAILMTSVASRRLLLLLATMVASVISGTARLRLLVAVRRLEQQTLGISVRVRILRLSSVLLAKVLRVMRRLGTLVMALRPLLLLRLLLETMGLAISAAVATVHRVIRHRRKRNRHLVLRTLETLGPARTLLFSSALREGLMIPGLLSVTLETDLPRLRRPQLLPETMGSVTLAATSPPLLQQLPSHCPPVPLTLAILA